jgi:endonuclease G, mitochondrial
MKLNNQVPIKVREGAIKRIKETLLEQKESYNKIRSKTRQMDAEKDEGRKISFIQRHIGVSNEIAEAIANYVNPEELPISDVKKSKAESLQGPTEDFMEIVFLDIARAASKSVGRVITGNEAPQGTGFMISETLFITNNHVIPDEDTARGFLVQFNYEEDYRGNLIPNTIFSFDPDTFFYTCPEDELDFTIVAIGKKKSGKATISDIGFLPLIGTDDKHIKTIFVNCIQHPGGSPKKLVVRKSNTRPYTYHINLWL